MKYAFIIDVAKCENCNNCFLSCKDEYCGNDWPGYTRPQPLHGHRWMDISQKERGSFPLIDVAYLPKPCMHCDDAPCLAAGAGVITKREDGIVLIDPVKAKGKKELTKSCPYGAIWWNEEEQLPQKCTLCAHLLDGGWTAPRCVQSCPTGALSFFTGEDEELQKKIAEDDLQILPQAEKTGSRPRCFYKNLFRYSQCFLAGSVSVMEGGIEECAAGAEVVLKKGTVECARQLTDDFGDFKFDGLSIDKQEYSVEIRYKQQSQKTQSVSLQDSVNLGTLLMSAA